MCIVCRPVIYDDNFINEIAGYFRNYFPDTGTFIKGGDDDVYDRFQKLQVSSLKPGCRSFGAGTLQVQW